MKYFNILLAIFTLTLACKQSESKPQPVQDAPVSESEARAASELGDTYGTLEGSSAELKAEEVLELYNGLNPQDTLQTRFRAEILEVCQAKGCWMRLALPDSQQVMVRFKDYGFFVPKDAAGKMALVEGKAFMAEVPEAERRHLAQDGGASEAELQEIQGAARELGFEARGVRIDR